MPKLMRNLISVGQLDSDGHTTTIGSSSWKVEKGSYSCSLGSEVGHALVDVELSRYGSPWSTTSIRSSRGTEARAHGREMDKDTGERRYDPRAKDDGISHMRELRSRDVIAY